jgi:hypothetical protein
MGIRPLTGLPRGLSPLPVLRRRGEANRASGIQGQGPSSPPSTFGGNGLLRSGSGLRARCWPRAHGEIGMRALRYCEKKGSNYKQSRPFLCSALSVISLGCPATTPSDALSRHCLGRKTPPHRITNLLLVVLVVTRAHPACLPRIRTLGTEATGPPETGDPYPRTICLTSRRKGISSWPRRCAPALFSNQTFKTNHRPRQASSLPARLLRIDLLPTLRQPRRLIRLVNHFNVAQSRGSTRLVSTRTLLAILLRRESAEDQRLANDGSNGAKNKITSPTWPASIVSIGMRIGFWQLLYSHSREPR